MSLNIFNHQTGELEGTYKLTRPKIDYLSVIGEVHSLRIGDANHLNYMKSLLQKIGLKFVFVSEKGAFFENKDSGLRAYFSNFIAVGQDTPKLKIEATGHFWIKKRAYETFHSITRTLKESLGTSFLASRLDIAQDIIGARDPFSYFPDFRDRNNLWWGFRGEPDLRLFYNNKENLYSPTGFSYRGSKFNIVSYDRQISLDKKYAKREITQGYFDYYKKIYRNNPTQRFEVRLTEKYELQTFNTFMFAEKFGDRMELSELLELTLSRFAVNRPLVHRTSNKLSKCEIDPIFATLFYLNEVDCKKIIRENEELADIKISDLEFSRKGRKLEEVVKMLARKICELSAIEDDSITNLCKKSDNLLSDFISQMKGEIHDRKARYEKTMELFDMNYQDMSEMIEEECRKFEIDSYKNRWTT